jgi:hypothetical protein
VHRVAQAFCVSTVIPVDEVASSEGGEDTAGADGELKCLEYMLVAFNVSNYPNSRSDSLCRHVQNLRKRKEKC